METTSSMNYAGQSQSNQENPLKKWVIILGALAGIFLCTTIYFARFAKPTINKVYTQVEAKNVELQSELNELLAEHERIKEQYGELSEQLSEKDSIIMAGAAEIEKLINSQADYNRIKKQLARLQNISQEYVQEMDDLCNCCMHVVQRRGLCFGNGDREDGGEGVRGGFQCLCYGLLWRLCPLRR